MKVGYIYALQNKSFGDYLIKIGMTTREPDIRAKEMYCGSSGVPEPFDVAFACQVADCAIAERKVHETLKAYRNNKSREFFIISIEVAKRVILSVCKEINESMGFSVPDSTIIDSQALDESDSTLEENHAEDSSKIVWLDSFDKILAAPAGRSTLSDEQKQRVEVIAEIFANVYPKASQDWIIGFSRDTNPEKEVSIWENIAKAFLKIDRVKYLEEEHKKEALLLLVMRSMMSVGKVLESFELKIFSRRAAKEILRGYEANPIPITISGWLDK